MAKHTLGECEGVILALRKHWPCGCKAQALPQKGGITMRRCPKHAAAEVMYEGHEHNEHNARAALHLLAQGKQEAAEVCLEAIRSISQAALSAAGKEDGDE